MLDTINSRHQRVVVGVRLQQLPDAIVKSISNRLPFRACRFGAADAAGDRNPQRTPGACTPLNELKDKLEAMEGVQFKQLTPLPITTR